MLNRLAIAAAALAVLGASSVCAQPAPDRGSGAPPAASAREDAGSYLDARISALHSRLQLTPEQEPQWPAFEKAYRDLAKLRSQRGSEPPAPDDPVARMQRRADALTRRGAAVKALADAAAPLWQSFDDGQKRRFAALVLPSNGRGERGGSGGERDRDGFAGRPRDFGPDGRGRDGEPRRFGGSGRDGDYGRGPRGFAPEGRGRDGDGDRYGFGGDRGSGRRGFDGPGRDGDYGYGERRGFGRFGRNDDYGRGPRGFGPEGRDGNRDRYGFGGERGFGPRGYEGPRRDYGDGERRGFGRPDRDGDYGRGPRDFRPEGRGSDRYGFEGRREFGPRSYDGPGRDGDYGGRRGFGERDFRREFGGRFGNDYGRGRLPWWHPDVGPGRGRPGGSFRTLDEPGAGERSDAGDEQI
jgi:zinc resistance-associated protein